MNGRVSRRIRREVYGDNSPRARKYSRSSSGSIITDALRREYQRKKKQENNK